MSKMRHPRHSHLHETAIQTHPRLLSPIGVDLDLEIEVAKTPIKWSHDEREELLDRLAELDSDEHILEASMDRMLRRLR